MVRTISFDTYMTLRGLGIKKQLLTTKLEQWNKYSCSILSSKRSLLLVRIKSIHDPPLLKQVVFFMVGCSNYNVLWMLTTTYEKDLYYSHLSVYDGHKYLNINQQYYVMNLVNIDNFAMEACICLRKTIFPISNSLSLNVRVYFMFS